MCEDQSTYLIAHIKNIYVVKIIVMIFFIDCYILLHGEIFL